MLPVQIRTDETYELPVFRRIYLVLHISSNATCTASDIHLSHNHLSTIAHILYTHFTQPLYKLSSTKLGKHHVIHVIIILVILH